MVNSILRPTLVITLVAFFSAFALSHINHITHPNILKQEKEKQLRALGVVLPGYHVGDKQTKELNGETFVYWVGEKTENFRKSKAYAFITEKNGYSGAVRSMVGVDEKGKILGLSIIQQTETPGLGARSTEIASSETFWQHYFGGSSKVEEGTIAPWFQEQFASLNANQAIEIQKKGDWNKSMREELLSKNAISAITGATITSRTVTGSVTAGYLKLKKALGEVK